MLTLRFNQEGMTLVELLVGMLIGLLVAAVGVGLFATAIKAQTDNIRLVRLNQDMRALMDIMVRDIRRAGFVMDADPDGAENLIYNNPFFDPSTDISIYSTSSLTDNCILYAYNENHDEETWGVDLPSVDSSDFLGFQLDGVTHRLKMRKSGSANESASCSEPSKWEDVIDPNVEITALTFTLTTKTLNVTSILDGTGDDNGNGLCDSGEGCVWVCDSSLGCNCDTGGACACDPSGGCIAAVAPNCIRDNSSPDPACIYVRDVVISLSGRVLNDPSVNQTISERVRIRNDRFLPPDP